MTAMKLPPQITLAQIALLEAVSCDWQSSQAIMAYLAESFPGQQTTSRLNNLLRKPVHYGWIEKRRVPHSGGGLHCEYRITEAGKEAYSTALYAIGADQRG